LQEFLIHFQIRIARIRAGALQNLLHLFFHAPAGEHVDDDEGPRIDHGVERAVIPLIDVEGIEGVTAGFHAHMLQSFFASVSVEDHAVRDDFGDRLERKAILVITGREDLTLNAGNGETELVTVFRYVRRVKSYVAAVWQVDVALVNLFQLLPNGL